MQEHCAMKVGTDGVLLGAWTKIPQSGNVLDVGTGTGLLALMVAQKNPLLTIDALEIDPQAALQANENVKHSPWATQVTVHQADFFNWSPKKLYDLIICNPPFLNQGPPARTTQRMLARSEKYFSINEFLSKAQSMLTPFGFLSLILPYEKFESTIINQNTKLSLSRLLKVKPTPQKNYNRALIELSLNIDVTPEVDELTIEMDSRHQYSREYIDLTRDFYLKF